MTSTTTWAEKQQRLDTMPRPTQPLRICADPDIRDRFRAAKEAVPRAEDYLKSLAKDADKDVLAMVKKQVKETQEELKAAQAAYDDNTVVLTFKALERGELRTLIAEHPPLEEDEEKGAEFHFDTFAPALIAAASLDGMPLEYATGAMTQWLLSDWQALWNAAWGVQQRQRTDLGKG